MKIPSVVFLVISVLVVVVPLHAQDETPQVELYGGYSYVHFSVHAGEPPFSATFNANGGSGQLEYNVNRWLGVVGDLGGYYVSTPPTAGVFSYMFGPRVNLRGSTVTTFAHVLLGGTTATGGINQVGAQNAFAMAAGGGVEINVTRSLAIRPVQTEYYMTRFSDGLNNRQNNFRFGAGIVLRLNFARK